MSEQSSTVARRQEMSEVTDYLDEKEADLFIFRELGDEISGVVLAARRAVTEIDGKIKKTVKGEPAKHLEILLDNDGQEIRVDIMSRNQKEALRQALAVAQVRGLAPGDHFRMAYTYDDAPIKRGNKELTPARGYECEVSVS